jgi:glycopeptide antibiotics resistance protein
VILATVLILAATLVPVDPTRPLDWEQVLCVLCGRAAVADALSNLALFFPLGVALGLRRIPPRRAVLMAAGLSVAIELAQFAIPGRDPSLGDVAFNTAGAAMGCRLARIVPWLLRPPAGAASRLSLMAAVAGAAVFVLTDVLLRPSLPETTYFAGSSDVHDFGRPLRLGGTADDRGYFQGRIDDVRVYRRARSESEVRRDMAQPVKATIHSTDLVAAYNFDEGHGSLLTDLSGYGNSGTIHGAVWSDRGHSGHALEFNGVHDAVVIPHAPSLALTRDMTLEAWVYPTAVQRGWRAVLQKDFDAYFLLSSSRAGALKPAGGGTFGDATESVVAPMAMPLNTWTHMAWTYDGAVGTLYVNGTLTARRLRWYPAPFVSATLGGLPLASGLAAESSRLRAELLAGTPVTIKTIAVARVPSLAPLASLHDVNRNEILLIAAEGHDVIIRLRSRAAAAELDSPPVRAAGILRGVSPGDALTMTIGRSGGRLCVVVNERSECGLGFTLGMGWTLLAYSQVRPGWPQHALNGLWGMMLLFPFGFWLRARWASIVGVLVLVGSVLLSCTLGAMSISALEVGTDLLGIATGLACRAVFAR